MSSRRRRVVVSAAARGDLRDALAFTQDRWGIGKRREYRRRILDVFEHIAMFPELGKVMPEHSQEARGFRVGQHIVVYKVSDAELAVARLMQVRRDTGDNQD